MTIDQLTAPAVTTVGWAIRVTTPAGHQHTNTCRDLLSALGQANAVNRTYPGTAQVVYRSEEYGPWIVGPYGDEFGIEYQWPDGRTEVEAVASREDADSRVRMRNYSAEGSHARVVSRVVRHGEWAPFESAPTTPPRQHPFWWARGWMAWLGVLLLAVSLTPFDEVAAVVLAAVGVALIAGPVLKFVTEVSTR
ncbi:hypothetical protein E1211_29740 [Micromonospora sp. 15K316]|uniref:hypothetical protein n=1 Tax=Micromonospora sp. 15K316 TaxID=2530376 RepID=UPI001043458B|nr:hypothetical protein [Micromonospora sp. 15K316]TDC26881.1 hypothetical protein E1211_29740 [Micromonospora sp. 15K316]